MPELSRSQRAADWITAFCGSWPFIFVFAGFTVLWLIFNTILLFSKPFDPYPFILLNLVFTVIELFQGPLILMSEHRQMERDSEMANAMNAKLDRLLERE